MKTKTRLFDIEDRKIFEEDGKIYMTGYANTKGHADSYGDIPTSLNGEPVYDITRMESNPVCFVDHMASAANIAGNFVMLKEDARGLAFKLLFRNLDTIFNDKVKDAVSAFTGGFGRALSIGGDWIHGDQANSSHLTKAIISEISIVGVGADEFALSTASYPKNMVIKHALLGEAITNRLKVKLGVEKMQNSQAKGAVLARILNDAIAELVNDDTTRVDIIGEMADAAGIESGTVGQILNESIDIPPEDRLRGFARVLGVTFAELQRAVEEDGEKSAFGSFGLKTLNDVNDIKTVRDLEQLLRSMGCTKEASKVVASRFKSTDGLVSIAQSLKEVCEKIKH